MTVPYIYCVSERGLVCASVHPFYYYDFNRGYEAFEMTSHFLNNISLSHNMKSVDKTFINQNSGIIFHIAMLLEIYVKCHSHGYSIPGHRAPGFQFENSTVIYIIAIIFSSILLLFCFLKCNSKQKLIVLNAMYNKNNNKK